MPTTDEIDRYGGPMPERAARSPRRAAAPAMPC